MTHTLEGGVGGGGGILKENGMTPMVERARHALKGTVPWQTGVLYLLHSSCLLRRKKNQSSPVFAAEHNDSEVYKELKRPIVLGFTGLGDSWWLAGTSIDQVRKLGQNYGDS